MRSVLVVGAGPVGSSLALALERTGVTVSVVDPDPRVRRAAAAVGVPATASVRERADLAVVAVPQQEAAQTLAALQRQDAADGYTDVLPVKLDLRGRALALGCDPAAYIGGHPVVDQTGAGPLAARADLFRGRPWVITPTADSRDSVLNQVLELAALCGATSVVAEAEEHDRAVALVEHAPYLLASLMLGQLSGEPSLALRLSGERLRGPVRGAADAPGQWAAVLAANAGPVADVLERVSEDLVQLTGLLRDLAGPQEPESPEPGSPEPGSQAASNAAVGLAGLLARASAGRSRIPGRDSVPGTALIGAEIGDRRGEVVRLLADVAAAGVDLGDVELRSPDDRGSTVVEFTVPAGAAHRLAGDLCDRGWQLTGSGRRPLPA